MHFFCHLTGLLEAFGILFIVVSQNIILLFHSKLSVSGPDDKETTLLLSFLSVSVLRSFGTQQRRTIGGKDGFNRAGCASDLPVV